MQAEANQCIGCPFLVAALPSEAIELNGCRVKGYCSHPDRPFQDAIVPCGFPLINKLEETRWENCPLQ